MCVRERSVQKVPFHSAQILNNFPVGCLSVIKYVNCHYINSEKKILYGCQMMNIGFTYFYPVREYKKVPREPDPTYDITYTENVFWPWGEGCEGLVLLFLILRVKTMIDRVFPIKPIDETIVKSMPSIISVDRSSAILTETLWNNVRCLKRTMDLWRLLGWFLRRRGEQALMLTNHRELGGLGEGLDSR